MHSDTFEKAFGDFLDRREYDAAENALFAMVRISFLAGWRAAGGDPPKPQKILTFASIQNDQRAVMKVSSRLSGFSYKK